jgi:parallel beta-helix repeat protein
MALVLTACAVGGCGSGGGSPRPDAPRVLRVPGQYPTIQAAVRATRPGDLVLIGRGVYRESVAVDDEHPRIVLRGVDRDGVVLDGGDRRGDGIAVHADGVAVENLTVRHYLVNGVVWSPSGEYGDTGRQLQGWRGSYITAYDNGLYGVYAFGAEHGRFDHVYASGQPDSGVYVGRCRPCHALVRDSVAEHNQVGYEATNASGDVTVARNAWRRNRVGVEINALRKEDGFPQRSSLLEDNDISDNNAADAPRGSEGFGAGVVVNGGAGDVVRGNRVSGHRRVGIVVLDSPDAQATDNTVRDNTLRGNAVDLALQTASGRTRGTCFAANAAARSVPARLQARTARACGRSVAVGTRALPRVAVPARVDYRTVPAPPPQPSMPGAATAPARPATGRPEAGR